jgi:hypothetical protein
MGYLQINVLWLLTTFVCYRAGWFSKDWRYFGIPFVDGQLHSLRSPRRSYSSPTPRSNRGRSACDSHLRTGPPHS